MAPLARRNSPRLAAVVAVVAILLAGSTRLGAAPAAPADEPSTLPVTRHQPSPDSSQIGGWIRQLDDDQYASREAAQKKLVNAGMAALAEVSRVAESGALEGGTRATNILAEWSEAEDHELSLAALERIAALKSHPAEAAIAQGKLGEIREATAIDEMRKLGGVCRNEEPNAVGIDPWKPPLQVVIGPKWTGGVDGLKLLGDMPRLTTLSFWNPPLGENAIATLKKLPGVKRGEFFGVALSDDAKAKLAAALPGAVLDVRGPCRLGIAGNPMVGLGGAQVERVVGTPALKAGLMPGDVISEIDGTPVKDFKHLTDEISKSTPGKAVKLTVVRQGAAIPMSVAFDRWGDEVEPPAELAATAADPRYQGNIITPPTALQPQLPEPIVIPRRSYGHDGRGGYGGAHDR